MCIMQEAPDYVERKGDFGTVNFLFKIGLFYILKHERIRWANIQFHIPRNLIGFVSHIKWLELVNVE